MILRKKWFPAEEPGGAYQPQPRTFRRSRRTGPYGMQAETKGESWQDKVPEEAWFVGDQAYWSDSQASVSG